MGSNFKTLTTISQKLNNEVYYIKRLPSALFSAAKTVRPIG